MRKTAIRIITTGGTIDSSENYDPEKKSVFAGYGTNLPKMLEQSRTKDRFVMDALMLKDSADINDSDRNLVLEHIQNAPEDRIVILHGTSAMADTARFLGPNIKNKTVVLVGSITPYTQKWSDALFNLGYAIATAKVLPNGVYVAMNGKTFNWDNVKKNTDSGVFENMRS